MERKVLATPLIIAAICMIMATEGFPHAFFAERLPGVFRFFQVIQFPWRLFGPATIALSVSMVLGAKIGREALHENYMINTGLLIIAAITCLMAAEFHAGANQERESFYAFDEAIGLGEYIPKGTGSFQRDIIVTETVNAEILEEKGVSCSLAVSNRGDIEGYTEIPRIYYPGYRAVDQSGQALEVKSGENNHIRITIPSGYEGKVTVDFREPFIWRMSEMISITSAVMLIVIANMKRQRLIIIGRMNG